MSRDLPDAHDRARRRDNLGMAPDLLPVIQPGIRGDVGDHLGWDLAAVVITALVAIAAGLAIAYGLLPVIR